MCQSVGAACRDRDGKFQLKELLDFAQYVHDMSSDLQLYELQSAVHGTCMLDLWRGINTEPGMSAIVQWCARISPIEPLYTLLGRCLLTPTATVRVEHCSTTAAVPMPCIQIVGHPADAQA